MKSLHGREAIKSEDAAATSFIAQDEFVVSPGVTVKLNDGTVLNSIGSCGIDMIQTGRLASSRPDSCN